jgi:tetratricopeptide (TPR) repeat protein
MVVFGVPAVHDDDAERAVRAAIEIRDGAADLAVRVGVNSGEAVTAASDDRQFMVSGDAVNVAARLQQGAEPGEVVVGDLTHQLTRKVIDYEARAAVAAKGKPEPLTAYRALRARTEIPEQSRGVPGLHASLVGRSRELRLLGDTFERASEDRSLHLFTIIGTPGIGKSRLVGEALETLAGSGARVLRGRCLPYGRGITYWPLVEMLRQDTGITLSDDRDTALAKMDRWLYELLDDDPQRPALRGRLSVMMGLETAQSAMSDTPAERVEREIGWAVRRYMEGVARMAPLIMVIDDVQWAEPPVLAIVEQLAERVSDVPIVVVCVARPEFLESHIGWGAGKPNATTITLDPLNPKETATLISRLLDIEALPAELRDQIIERSAGTPLFCEEFIHMLIDDGKVVRDGERWRAIGTIEQIQVPHGINAVVGARLDLLTQEQRDVLQAAGVIGERFQMRQLQRLLPDVDVESETESLRRKGFVTGGDGRNDEYHFRHLLIRDAAYGSLPKSQRAALHDRFRSVLETEAGDPQHIVEILAHHAERAFMLSRELGLEEAVVQDRARQAIRWLLEVAERSRRRHDVGLVQETLETLRSAAASLPDGGGTEARARLRLLEAQLHFMKADYQNAGIGAAEAAAIAEEANLLSVVATARLTEAWIHNWTLQGSVEDFERALERAIEACHRAGDMPAEIEARHVASNLHFAAGRLVEFVAVNEELLSRARSIGDTAHVAAITARLVAVEATLGDMEAAARNLAEADSLAAQHGLRNVALRVMFDKGSLLMWAGDLASAERAMRDYERAAIEAGAAQHQISSLRFLGYALLFGRRPGEAGHVLDQALELSLATGERWNRTELFGLRARAALDTGDLVGAEQYINRALGTWRDGDITAMAEIYTHVGAIRSAQGRDAEAEAAFRQALGVLAGTDYAESMMSLDTKSSLAQFLANRGQTGEAAQLLDQVAGLVDTRGWHAWDRSIAEIRELLPEATAHDAI